MNFQVSKKKTQSIQNGDKKTAGFFFFGFLFAELNIDLQDLRILSESDLTHPRVFMLSSRRLHLFIHLLDGTLVGGHTSDTRSRIYRFSNIAGSLFRT